MTLRRQQFVASSTVNYPSVRLHEKGLLVLLSSIVRGRRDAILLVKPGTVVLFAHFIVDVHAKRAMHVVVMPAPTVQWTA